MKQQEHETARNSTNKKEQQQREQHGKNNGTKQKDGEKTQHETSERVCVCQYSEMSCHSHFTLCCRAVVRLDASMVVVVVVLCGCACACACVSACFCFRFSGFSAYSVWCCYLGLVFLLFAKV